MNYISRIIVRLLKAFGVTALLWSVSTSLIAGLSESSDLNEGLVGYWNFDDPDDLGLDSSGLGNHGVVTPGDVTYTADGRVNGAAKFVEGTIDDAIRVPHSDSLNLTEAITMAAWVKLDGVNSDNGDTIFAKDRTTQSYAFFASLDDVFGGAMGAWFSGVPLNSDSVIPDNVWTHIAATYDGATVKYYVDGSFLTEKASSVGLIPDLTADLYIGASPFGAPEDFSGLMDEARIYNRVLSEAEIFELFDKSITEISIDIKPRDRRNVVNLRAKGKIRVAILSDSNPDSPFDPLSQVNVPTVEFGPDGARTSRYKVKDINRDGLGDLVLRFRLSETGIVCGDREATLIGETFDGQSFTGTDFIKTVGCPRYEIPEEAIQNPYNGHWYLRYDTPMSWHDARAFCERKRGYLATITSQAEDDFVFVYLGTDVSTGEVWLGGTGEDWGRIWWWITGKPWGDFWNDSETEDEGRCNSNSDCGIQKPFICEWDSKQVRRHHGQKFPSYHWYDRDE